MAYKYFQYTKDRDTNTDTGVKIYWRCENRKCKTIFIFSVQISFRPKFDVISTYSTNFRPIVVVGETS